MEAKAGERGGGGAKKKEQVIRRYKKVTGRLGMARGSGQPSPGSWGRSPRDSLSDRRDGLERQIQKTTVLV